MYISFDNKTPNKENNCGEFSTIATNNPSKSSKQESYLTVKINSRGNSKFFREENVYITVIALFHSSIGVVYYFYNDKVLNLNTAPTRLLESQEPKFIYVNEKKHKTHGQKFKEKYQKIIDD